VILVSGALLLIPLAACGSGPEPSVVTRIEKVLPADPVGFPTAPVPMPPLPEKPPETAAEWEVVARILKAWGMENYSIAAQWPAWWKRTKEIYGERPATTAAPSSGR
jgi:hypothetical protein